MYLWEVFPWKISIPLRAFHRYFHRNYTKSCSCDSEADRQKNVVCYMCQSMICIKFIMAEPSIGYSMEFLYKRAPFFCKMENAAFLMGTLCQRGTVLAPCFTKTGTIFQKMVPQGHCFGSLFFLNEMTQYFLSHILTIFFSSYQLY